MYSDYIRAYMQENYYNMAIHPRDTENADIPFNT
jgi:hypothetical protein